MRPTTASPPVSPFRASLEVPRVGAARSSRSGSTGSSCAHVVRAQGRGVEHRLPEGLLHARRIVAVRPARGEERRDLRGRHDGAILEDALRPRHVEFHRIRQREPQLSGRGEVAEGAEGQLVLRVDPGVHDALQILLQRARRHGVAGEHVLSLRPLEQQVPGDHVQRSATPSAASLTTSAAATGAPDPGAVIVTSAR